MTNTDDFYVRICGCGVVHLSFGATTLNLSSEAVIAVTETLKGISREVRTQLKKQMTQLEASAPSSEGNVVQGRFPVRV